MAALLFILTHSTDDPERAGTGLQTALAAAEAGHDVALWLTGEGVRLGVKAVAETIREPFSVDAAGIVERLVARGARLHCSRPAFERRGFKPDALRKGAVLADDAELARLASNGRVPLTL